MRRIDSRIPCRMRTQAVPQGRSERRGESVLPPDGQPLRDASTPPADVFRILLEPGPLRIVGLFAPQGTQRHIDERVGAWTQAW